MEVLLIHLKECKIRKGRVGILEADESDGSFLKLPINYSVVTNLDHEHIDFVKILKI